MRLAAALAVFALLAPRVAIAITPEDFQGTWVVKRDVGSRDALGPEGPRKMWGTKVRWTADEITDAEGTCKLVDAAVVPMSNIMLQLDIWGGQSIKKLQLPKSQLAQMFRTSETPVFNGGNNYCLQAVMLNQRQILGIFENGYIYLLERTGSER